MIDDKLLLELTKYAPEVVVKMALKVVADIPFSFAWDYDKAKRLTKKAVKAMLKAKKLATRALKAANHISSFEIERAVTQETRQQ